MLVILAAKSAQYAMQPDIMNINAVIFIFFVDSIDCLAKQNTYIVDMVNIPLMMMIVQSLNRSLNVNETAILS